MWTQKLSVIDQKSHTLELNSSVFHWDNSKLFLLVQGIESCEYRKMMLRMNKFGKVRLMGECYTLLELCQCRIMQHDRSDDRQIHRLYTEHKVEHDKDVQVIYNAEERGDTQRKLG